MSLSIIILTKNSEESIVDCIESLKGLGDEVIVTDSESTDRTVEIAKRVGAQVVEHGFKDFSDQRNFAIKQAQGEWVLYIDSDEEASEEFKKEVKEALANYEKESNIGGYFIRRRNFYFGKDWHFIDRVQRLFYKKNFIEWEGRVHETPRIKGKFGEIRSPILHYTHTDLSLMVKKTNEWSEFEAELRFKTHHPKMTTWRFFRVMITGFVRSYFFENGYKNGTEGLIEALYQTFSMFITYAKLWERQIRRSH